MSNENWNSWNNYYPSAPESQQAKETSPWVYSIVAIAVMAFLVGVSLAAFAILGNNKDDGGESAAPGDSTQSSSTVAAKSTEPAGTNESSDEAAESTESSAPSGSHSSEESTAAPKTPNPDAPGGSSAGAGYKLSSHGWEGSPAYCNADDEWLYAAYGDGDYVVVCQVGRSGDYYYRGDVGGHEMEKDVDMSFADPARGSYRVPVGGGTRIEINQKSLKVFEDGKLASDVRFDAYFVGNS
ncbi:hypothetical protein [Corynebacterium macclintockiae]|uniref:hypothetical protein n=1 Tax=Corynebacterium macclintockiae TaxID=2913501 RepID=UPI003EBE1A3B